MRRIFQYTSLLFLLTLSTSCAIADLRTDELATNSLADAEARGRALLQRTYDAMNYAPLMATDNYAVTANFDWAAVWSAMPMNSLPGAKNTDIRFRFATNTFDGHLEFLEGPKQGQIYGTQSWTGYKRDFTNAPVEALNSKRYAWGLPTYHYMLEGPARLLGAPIVRYAGERSVNGIQYETVFVTWGDGTDRKNYDQWLVYVNKETGFTDLAEVTITDFFLPMPGGMKNATIRYPERKKTSVGTYLPTSAVIQLGHPKESLEKDVYTFTLTGYTFDETQQSELYPMPNLPMYGDSKPESE